jgi:aldehyde dehydrogenase (NAD+)
VHIANPSLPFGGIMNSGSGRYHGKDGFLNLSNIKSITNTSSSIDIPLRYPPYSNFKEKVIKLFF